MRWFRLHADAVDDPKLRLLAFEDRWHFVALMCMKCDGLLDDKKDSDLLDRLVAAKLGLASRDADEVKRRLIEVDLIDDSWQPLNWDKRQYTSDSSAERTRKWREKQRDNNLKRHGDVTVTPPDTDSDTDTKAEKRKSASRSPAKRLPDDFSLTPERRAVAEAEEVPAERTFETFRDYWLAASGQKARKHDWDAAWRNWCRKQADWSRGQSSGKTKYEQMMEAMDG